MHYQYQLWILNWFLLPIMKLIQEQKLNLPDFNNWPKFLKFCFNFFSEEFLSNQGKNWECSTRPQIVQKHFQILDFSTSENINSYGLC